MSNCNNPYLFSNASHFAPVVTSSNEDKLINKPLSQPLYAMKRRKKENKDKAQMTYTV